MSKRQPGAEKSAPAPRRSGAVGSRCPHCGVVIPVQATELDNGDVVYGSAIGSLVTHVTVHGLDGSVRCEDRPATLAAEQVRP